MNNEMLSRTDKGDVCSLVLVESIMKTNGNVDQGPLLFFHLVFFSGTMIRIPPGCVTCEASIKCQRSCMVNMYDGVAPVSRGVHVLFLSGALSTALF